MQWRILILLGWISNCTFGEKEGHVSVSHGTSFMSFGHFPRSDLPSETEEVESVHPTPGCAQNTGKSFCLEDEEYPRKEIEDALKKYHKKIEQFYAEILSKESRFFYDFRRRSTDKASLCRSDVVQARILRAQNSEGKWRVIVNDVEAGYGKTLTQTTLIEECLSAGNSCPLVPHCNGSKCVQKSTYERFLVYNSDKYFPFVVENFKIPTSCGCLLEESEIH